MKINRIIAVDRHRNGICGAPFDVVLFEDAGDEGGRKFAVLFEPQYFCAVLDVDKLAAGDIAFGSDSWRGDDCKPALRNVVQMHHRMLPNDDPGQTVPEIDVHQLLAARREVAVIWSIEDVQEVRPDLTDDQAWEVLKRCYDKHDCEGGFTWQYIEDVADIMFPEQPSTREE